jgi:hypothetical protein
MYSIEITYDTGDSFHKENDVKGAVREISWKNEEKAKQAIKEIEEHYMCYMVCHKEWNADKEDIKKAREKAMKAKWCSEVCDDNSSNRDDWNYSLMLENDDGERVNCSCFWVGYFEHLVGADIVCERHDDGRSFRVKRY